MSAKKKLEKFAKVKTFPHFFEPVISYEDKNDFEFKGKWNEKFFNNNNRIIAEFGCGKGEYSVNIAKDNENINVIAVDIKGARMWRGATDSFNLGLKNIAFVRTMIDNSPFCFGENEISEIWITFPDPQLGHKKRIKKRLTSATFLTRYQSFLIDNGVINLKTDDDTLYNYTKNIIIKNNLELIIDTDDLYNSEYYTDILTIKTHYEKMWNKENKTIKYLKFLLPKNRKIEELELEIED